LNLEIIQKISNMLNLRFTNEKEDNLKTFAPIDVLDYVYAVLHNPSYRKKFKALLKIDFPRVPYPQDPTLFRKLVTLGNELRTIHLFENSVLDNLITTYPISGNNLITTFKFESGRIFINDNQYFDNVPNLVWDFYIGGYQPAQKWLKDRKGRELTFDEILHYQKIIVALDETDRLMKEIDIIEHF